MIAPGRMEECHTCHIGMLARSKHRYVLFVSRPRFSFSLKKHGNPEQIAAQQAAPEELPGLASTKYMLKISDRARGLQTVCSVKSRPTRPLS